MYSLHEIVFEPSEIIEYLRKSRSDDPILSVEEVLQKHESILNDWCDRTIGSRIPEENIYREVVSGETIDDRPEMLKLLNRIESPKIKAILAVEVQRLSRGDLEDAGRLIKLLRYTNTMVITPQKIYDLQDDYDRDAFERELKRGNEYLEYQKKIMSRGRLLSVQQGNFIGSIPPYGYEKIFVQEGKRRCPTLKIKEDEANIVRMIFDMYVNQNMGYAKICRYLDSIGVNPPKGKNWSPFFIADMLVNVHYIGKVKWNRRKTVNIVESGEVIKTRPKSDDYLIFDGKHEAIISEELFHAAADRMGKNPRAKARNQLRNPLAGLLYCQCGRAMSLRYYMQNGVERSAPRFLCDNQVHCHTASSTYDEIMQRVEEILQNSIRDIQIKIKDDRLDSSSQHEQVVKSLERQLKKLEEKELSMWENFVDNNMPKEIFDRMNEKIKKEKADAQAALKNAELSRSRRFNYEERLITFTEALNALHDSDISTAEKNSLLKSCIWEITYSRDREMEESNGKVIWKRGSSPIELNMKLRL